MASKPMFVVMMVCLTNASALAIRFRSAKEFKVDWVEPLSPNASFYNLWSSAMRFHIGDSLVFEYNNDSVLVVEKWGYYHCETSNPMIAFDNGNTTVSLDRAGLFYFISGATNHCKHGQRMIVHVMSSHSPSAALPPDAGFQGSPSPALGSGSPSVSVPAALRLLLTALAGSVATLVI